ncbi:polyprenyl synthetase family protein [Aeromicrobium fastidiosum]|uniref:Polyprenyl synthetase family protein n=1 Tax=Aeromicrobium fastidiosum TaxID=52699 RepID=A0A641ALG8_9ACTN|nr:polyprenyl synthetase family protein [Aeromicrobium fastidiosum]KAA1374816.1 polyprenyl synthetase family protein [Aeromicrobium fastidiosum]MBP2390628.1 heptaprenyl diphosphate synthase [Aeromicrobium fastidiosum]
MSTLGVSFTDAALEARVSAGVDEVERQLVAAVDSPSRLVAEAAAHLLNAGGKRFRPLLVMLAAEFGDPSRPEVANSAVVVELTHLATLYHDDVMDEADIRRGAPSANSRWGNSVAILVGDFLFAQASDLVSDLGPDAVRIQARTFSRLVQGQIRETIGPDETEDALAHYLGVVADKTGSLIATAARFGAMMAGASDDVQETLTEFGERIGAAFQLADDVIDVASETGDSGKTPGTDLREGVPTLPTLIALRSTDDASARLRELLSKPLTDDAEHAEALALLRVHPAIAEARSYVQAEADAAGVLLAKLPDSPARAALQELCDTVATRLG